METTMRDYTGVTMEQIADEMLKENTGTHFLDSGGAYGRSWQRNQGKDFSKQPKCWFEWSTWRKQGETGHGKPELCATVSLYHWLCDNFELDVEMQQRLDEFAEENPNEGWLGILEEFAENEQDRFDTGAEVKIINTYNFPDNCDLSQTVQYAEVYSESKYEPSHYILSVHGGCDVRGGYGSPKCLKLRGDNYEVMDAMKARYISTDDGDFSWYLDSYAGTEPNDHDLGCLFDIPCYELDWLEDDLIKEFDELLAKCAKDKALLNDTTLDAEHKQAAIEQIEATAKEVEEEREQRALDSLSELHDTCTYIKDGKLILLHEGKAREVEVYAE